MSTSTHRAREEQTLSVEIKPTSRVGLGCMRLSTDEDRDDDRSLATLTAALDAGVSWLDTAHAYCPRDGELGHNEGLVARALASRPRAEATEPELERAAVRIVTKCGMARPGGRWQPDGRASTILAQARASKAALGRPADVLLLHAPDPRVPVATSWRALARARDEGLARAIGLSNVTRGQLEAAAAEARVEAVEVALGAFDDAAARGGVLSWCRGEGVPLLAHSPLGGPRRAGRLSRDPVLGAIAARHGATPAMIVVAYLLALDPCVVPLVGARRPGTAGEAVAAGRLVLGAEDLAALDARFPGIAAARVPRRRPRAVEATGEVVLVMGIAGSGKTRLAEAYVARGYERLNRDVIGGTLRGIAQRLGQRLAAGAKRVVLDNTYLTRASRSDVVRVAHAAGAIVRCVHVETPAHEAQVNCAWRMIERHGALLGGAELARRARADVNLFAPSVLFRMARQLEPPAEDEGFASIEAVPFVREHDGGEAAVAIPIELVVEARAADAVAPALRAAARAVLERVPAAVPVLLYGWRPGAAEEWRAGVSELVRQAAGERVIEVGLCTHASGPPVCWCRPPLPGLWLDFARRHGVDARRALLVAASPVHRTMARNLGLAEIALPDSAIRS